MILIGAGRHAVLLAEKIFEVPDLELLGFFDKNLLALPPFIREMGYEILGDDSVMEDYREVAGFHLALGGNFLEIRKKLIEKIENGNYQTVSIIHPTAYVAPSARLGYGVAILINSVIHTNAEVGDHSCVNTAAIIEHDCIVGKNVFIQPGCKLAGSVVIGDDSFIGINASIRDGVTIGSNCLIGGGSFVNSDIPDDSIAYGVPSKVVGKNRNYNYKY